MVPAIDEFDLMSGDSGGCVTTWMYCWADGTKKEECKTDNLLDTGRTSDPSPHARASPTRRPQI